MSKKRWTGHIKT